MASAQDALNTLNNVQTSLNKLKETLTKRKDTETDLDFQPVIDGGIGVTGTFDSWTAWVETEVKP